MAQEDSFVESVVLVDPRKDQIVYGRVAANFDTCLYSTKTKAIVETTKCVADPKTSVSPDMGSIIELLDNFPKD